MDYDRWKTTPPDEDLVETCADCGRPCTGRLTVPTYKRGERGEPLCSHCHELYNPELP
jgi:hypothetical protein